MAKRFKSKVAGSMHRTMAGLHKIGIVDKKTMREFDLMCLTKVEALSPREIRQLRETAGVSQEIFAQHIGVSKDLVSKWERGEKKPSGPSLKLLSLVKHKGLEAIA
ncbi:MAG: DNA-binding transcriptional regulator [Hyphomonadaceae bacterium]|jgi:putative transcriptional regulator|nr:DNA-binding transcriptional regulator [Hyphomonadaceae bacterium]